MSVEMAVTMWAFVSEQRSFVSVAEPRLADKTAVAEAVMQMRQPGVPINKLDGTMEQMDSFKQKAPGGYLMISEIRQGPFQDYIWGELTLRLFGTLDAGYSLMTTQHASGLDDVFEQICVGNQVDDAAASRIGLVIYIRRFGDETNGFWRRVTEVHEADRVEGGRAHGRLLHSWREADDTFEAVEPPAALQQHNGSLALAWPHSGDWLSLAKVPPQT